jgi:hypothetical protein
VLLRVYYKEEETAKKTAITLYMDSTNYAIPFECYFGSGLNHWEILIYSM